MKCIVCHMVWEDYLTARMLAKAHAKATGHRVEGETTLFVVYNYLKLNLPKGR